MVKSPQRSATYNREQADEAILCSESAGSQNRSDTFSHLAMVVRRWPHFFSVVEAEKLIIRVLRRLSIPWQSVA
jgi:hypothetical protein